VRPAPSDVSNLIWAGGEVYVCACQYGSSAQYWTQRGEHLHPAQPYVRPPRCRSDASMKRSAAS
jgi:hypothetical protein